jgi:hypothetical protein
VTLANRGDVSESIGAAQLQVTLVRRRRTVARLQGGTRKLLPRTRAVVRFRWRAYVAGDVMARIDLVRPGGRIATRTVRLRL